MIIVTDIVVVVVVVVGLLPFLHFISRMLLTHLPRFSADCKRQICHHRQRDSVSGWHH